MICVGDFNAFWGRTWNTEKNNTLHETAKSYSLYTPSYPEQFSYIMPGGKAVQLDHLITNIKDKKIKVVYDWTFINEHRYKPGIRAESEIKIKGLPDHAILKVDIE